MARPKTIDKQLSGRDRIKDIKPFSLEPLTEVPETPGWYQPYQREFFERICKSLIEAKQLREVDICNVELAAFWYQESRKAMDHINKHGIYQKAQSGWEQITPQATVLEKASKQLQAFADRYGLNLTSVQKIPKAKSDRNSLEDMMK